MWLPLQGKDRKKYGPSKELKVGIAYDGVLWSGGKSGKERRELHNKVAYTSFDSAAEYRERRMSPAEAWAAATKDHALETVSPGFAPMILGRELAHPGTVGDKLTVPVRDAETGERYTVSAVIDGRPLARGAQVLVWVNPMDCGKAYVADAQGRFIGVAETLQRVRADASP